jgi:serine/threonine-protein kinase RsbW
VAEIAASAGASERVVEDVRLCVGEAVTNAVLHAYRDVDLDPSRQVVEVTAERHGGELVVVVSDHGRGLASFRHEGDVGYGLKLIQRLTSRYVISSAPHEGTELRMVFALQADSPW